MEFKIVKMSLLSLPTSVALSPHTPGTGPSVLLEPASCLPASGPLHVAQRALLPNLLSSAPWRDLSCLNRTPYFTLVV